MGKHTGEEIEQALRIVSSTIERCEKVLPNFSEGTSQHTLLKNRIKALYISKALMKEEDKREEYTKEELTEALRPIISITNKCKKAQAKHMEGTSHFTRYSAMIKIMEFSKDLITAEIEKRE